MRHILTLLLSLMLCTAPAYGTEPSAGAVALVNGAVISMADYRSETARLLRLRKKSPEGLDNAARALLGKEALETLIGRELLYQESIKSGIEVKDADVMSEIAMLRNRFSSDEQFDESLRKLALSREGLATQIRRGIALQSLIEARFKEGLKISERELHEYYELHRDEFARLSRMDKSVPPFEDVRERIERQVRQERLLAEVAPLVKRLRDAARIEILLAGD